MSTPSTPSSGATLKFTLEQRLQLRESNTNPSKNSELSTLDSSLKKNTTFVRRLKHVSADNLDSIISEFSGLKLSKYIEEAASALLENRLKTNSDIFAVVKISSLFYQRYEEFRTSFLSVLIRELNQPLGDGSSNYEDKITWLGRQRQVLRLIAEIYLVGIFKDEQFIFKNLQKLLPEDEINGPNHVIVATSFVKWLGNYFMNLTIVNDDEATKKFVPESWRVKFTDLIVSYFKAMGRLLVRSHTKLISLESKSRYIYENKGDLSTNQASQLQESSEFFERLRTNLQCLSELLGMSLPDLGKEVESPKIIEGKIVFADPSISRSEIKSIIFDTEEERSFYEDPINLKELVPEILLSASAKSISEATILESSSEDLSGFKDIDPESVVGKPLDETLEPEDKKSAVNIKTFFDKLPLIQSRTLADQASIDFCYINSRGIRRRLADVLIELPYRRLDLLPFIGRFLVNLKSYFPDLISAINASLIGQFVFLFHRKEPIHGTRSRVCRYIGELVKFGVMPQTTAYAMLKKTVLEDLTAFNIDMASILIESCGRYLYHQPESHKRMTNLFEIINKKKTQGMDQSQIIMLENAMYIADPPDISLVASKPKSPRMAYLIKLLRVDLNSDNAENVFKKIRRFPWDDPDCRDELHRVFIKIWKIKYSNISLLASMMGSIRRIYPNFAIDLVDSLLEEIRCNLEANSLRLNQRLVTSTKYLGEAFCYSVVNEDIIFYLLNQFVIFGHSGIPRITMPSPIDPPENHFRIRLICLLLQTCSSFLTDQGLSKPLDEFIALFDYYIAMKRKLSSDIEFMLNDTFEELQRKRHHYDLKEATMRLVKVSNGMLSFLLDEVNGVEPESLEIEPEETELPSNNNLTFKEDEFEKALNGLITSGLQERKLERRIGAFDAPIPLTLLSSPRSPSFHASRPDSVPIKMLIKRKNKTTTKELHVNPQNAKFIELSKNERLKFEKEAKEVNQQVLESQKSVNEMGLLGPRRRAQSGSVTFSLYGGYRPQA